MSDRDPLWYKDAVFYELHVRAFVAWRGAAEGELSGYMKKLPVSARSGEA